MNQRTIIIAGVVLVVAVIFYMMMSKGENKDEGEGEGEGEGENEVLEDSPPPLPPYALVKNIEGKYAIVNRTNPRACSGSRKRGGCFWYNTPEDAAEELRLTNTRGPPALNMCSAEMSSNPQHWCNIDKFPLIEQD